MSTDAPQTETLPTVGNVTPQSLARRTLWQRLRTRYGHHGTLLRFSTASTLYSMATMLTGLVIYRWVEPADYGLWLSVLMIQVYASIIQGGVLNGLNRELPFNLGAGKDQLALEFAATAQSIALAGAAVLAVGGCVAAAFVPSARVGAGIAVVGLGSGVTLYRTYLASTYRAERAFELLARIRVVETVLELMTLPLVYFFGYYGLAGRYLFTTVVGATVNHFYRPLHAPIRFSPRHALTLLKVGVPIFIAGYFLQVSDTFPRVILLSAATGGATLVGLFGPAYSVVTLLQILPVALGQYIYPHMSHRLGKTGDPKDLWPVAWKTAVGILALSLPLLAVGELVVPWLIKVWCLPKYDVAIPAVRWAMITGAFLGASVAVNALLSLKAWRWLATYTAVVLSSAYVFPLVCFHTFADRLQGVAVGFLLAHALNFAVGMFAIYRTTHFTPRVAAAAR